MTRFQSAGVVVCLAAALSFMGLGLAGAQTETTDFDTGSASQVERGEYLVHSASMCVQCHSPRDRFGALRSDRLLTGGAVPVKSPYAGPRWAFQAPNLRNLPGYDAEDFLQLMQTGKRTDGTSPRLPMPPFRMSAADAEAVYAYLKSL